MEKKSVGLLELETAVLECFLEKTPLSPLGVKKLFLIHVSHPSETLCRHVCYPSCTESTQICIGGPFRLMPELTELFLRINA
jgi:hypothetical protein